MRASRWRPVHRDAPAIGLWGDRRIDAAAHLFPNEIAFPNEMGLFDGLRLSRMLGREPRGEAGQTPNMIAAETIGAAPLFLPPVERLVLPVVDESGRDAATAPDIAVAPDVVAPVEALAPLVSDPIVGDVATPQASAPDRHVPAPGPMTAVDDDPAKDHRTGGEMQAPAAPVAERPLGIASNGGTAFLDASGVAWFVDCGLGANITVSLRVAGTSTIAVDLAGAPSVADGQADLLFLSATNGVDSLTVSGVGTSYHIVGLDAVVNVLGSEGALDTLVVNGLGGNDAIVAVSLPAGVTRLTIDGGAGDDFLLGSQGADTILGGGDNDFVAADNGNDVAFLGAGNDVFEWLPGDGNDTIEGQDGTDRLRFAGSNASESITVLANGGRALFTRDVANVTMDLDDVEQIRFDALGGADIIFVGDLAGTDVALVEIELASGGSADGQLDIVAVVATNGNDVFGVSPGGGGLSVFGLAANTILLNPDATDFLTLNALAGDDVIDASGLAAGNIILTLNGGLGEDIFLGSAGNDSINGGDGDDTALMGAGNDIFTWNPGDDNDTLEGQDGTDRMLFNGSNVAEAISISANGGRALFFRNVASVTMDLNDTEIIEFNALGGADAITINDLAGTDVTTVQIHLAASNGLGDGVVDTVTINGTAGADNITLTNSGTTVTVTGLAYQVLITGFESGDQLVINTLGGDDVVDGDALDVNVAFTADGGENNDTLLGGAAADTLFGGNGNDFLQGNGGVDSLDGGAGVNTVIQ